MNTTTKSLIKFVCIASFILLFTLPSYPADLDKPYSPTKSEWLRVVIFQSIKIRTDVWRQRIGFVIWISDKENKVLITLSSANGEEPLSKEAQQKYTNIVRDDVEGLLQHYEWSKRLKAFVQFI